MVPQTGLVMQNFQDVMALLISYLPGVISALLVFLFSVYLAGLFSRMVRKAAQSRQVDPELTLLLSKITLWTFIGMGGIAALNQVGFNVTAFLTGLGVIGFTIGFAIQDVSKNFIAGLLLLLQQPFDIGDAIEVAGYSGSVITVDLRATEMRTFDGRLVQIPNADVFTSAIINYSRADKRRGVISLGVAYGTDLELARHLALDAICGVEGVCKDPAPTLFYEQLGAASVDLTINFWVEPKVTNLRLAKDTGIVAIERTYREAGVEIPFPTQTILLQAEETMGGEKAG